MIRRCFFAGAFSLLGLFAGGAAIAAPPPHEQSRIERLIKAVEVRKDMTFIRNGTEYDSADAAKFLRGKLDAMGKEVSSVRDFIERIASRSSMSGEPYRVKFADGRSMPASQFLSEELKRLEGQPA